MASVRALKECIMRTYKLNVTELDRDESIVVQYGPHRIEIEAVHVEDDGDYIEVRVPRGQLISNMVQQPREPGESEVFFTNPEWWSSLDPPDRQTGGAQELAGPLRFITFIERA